MIATHGRSAAALVANWGAHGHRANGARMAGRRADNGADSAAARDKPRGGARAVAADERMGAKPRRNTRGLRGDPRRLDGFGLGSGGSVAEVTNRRTRLSATIGRRLAGWLRRTSRVHAHLCNVIRLYGRERKSASGTNEWRARALAGDQTILADALIVAIGELTSIHDSIDSAMQATPATDAAPGTPAKVEVMARRVSRGFALFIDGDKPTDGGAAMDRG